MKIFDIEYSGLTNQEVTERIKLNKVNTIQTTITRSYKEIVKHNVFTFFNLINIILFSLMIFVGSYKNILFIFVVLLNTLTGIYQEIKAKRTLDKLSILTHNKVEALRDNQLVDISINEIVEDDLIILMTGNQVPADCLLIEGHIEVDESLLTGESNAVLKNHQDMLYSGSFITTGRGLCKVVHVGNDNYVNKILIEAKKSKSKNSQLSAAINKILEIISIIIVPVAVLLFLKETYVGHIPFNEAVVSVVAAVLGMIPSGLVLLTTLALTLSTLRLAKQNTLVQELFCIETLARVDTICLDKTGTLTEGKMNVEKLIVLNKERDVEKILRNMNHFLDDKNVTSIALLERFGESCDAKPVLLVPFSSIRKYSAVSFKDIGTAYIGAGQFLFPGRKDIQDMCKDYTKDGYRVLTVGFSKEILKEEDYICEDIECIGLIILSDIIRPTAKDTLEFFKKQKVDIKIISGDDPITVSFIAKNCGIESYSNYIDLSTLSDNQIPDIVEKYTIFGRVKPEQKKIIVQSLQSVKRTVAMTGDGINDVLALKASDCSIAMASGSDAAKNSSQIVLLQDNFDALPYVVNEGRRVINNITASSSMYLIKTIFSVLLSVGLIMLGHGYPFEPIQLTVISAFCVGIPTFFLTYEPNFHRVEGRFLKKVFKNAFPYALFIALTSIIIVNLGRHFGFSKAELTTVCVILTSYSYYKGLRHVYSPLSFYRAFIIFSMMAGLCVTFVFGAKIIGIVRIDVTNILLLIILIALSQFIYEFNEKLFEKIYNMYYKKKRHK